MYFGEGNAVTDFYVLQAGDGAKVPRGKWVSLSDNGCNDVVGGLGTDERTGCSC